MKIAILGGSGFIGTHLCSALNEVKLDFSIYDKVVSKKFDRKCVVGNILDKESLLDFIEYNSVIINLAAEHHDNVFPSSLYYSTNVSGAEHVCDVARSKNVRMIIFTSSVAVYGQVNKCVDETFEPNPSTDYGRSKLQAELIYKKWHLEDPLNRTLVIIRPTVVFGEGNRGNVYNLLNQIILNKFLLIGNGKNFKSLAYVINLVYFILSALNISKGIHIFNYVDKPDYTINQFVNDIYKIIGRNSKFRIRCPFYIGLFFGYIFDFLNLFFKINSPISSRRIKKFCSTSLFSSVKVNHFYCPPYSLYNGLNKTILYEFGEKLK